jgi:transcriptional regulator GlxA family with amidase domain
MTRTIAVLIFPEFQLLDDRRATTHWQRAALFARR